MGFTSIQASKFRKVIQGASAVTQSSVNLENWEFVSLGVIKMGEGKVKNNVIWLLYIPR